MFEKIEKYLQENESVVTSGKGISSATMKLVEDRLGHQLPKSYKLFLSKWGWLTFGSYDYFGVFEENLDLPNGMLAYTLREREAGRLLDQYVVCKDEEDFGLICLDVSLINDLEECPIIRWDPWGKTFENRLADTFADFLIKDLEEYINYQL